MFSLRVAGLYRNFQRELQADTFLRFGDIFRVHASFLIDSCWIILACRSPKIEFIHLSNRVSRCDALDATILGSLCFECSYSRVCVGFCRGIMDGNIERKNAKGNVIDKKSSNFRENLSAKKRFEMFSNNF